jgi:hypothetical protein
MGWIGWILVAVVFILPLGLLCFSEWEMACDL